MSISPEKAADLHIKHLEMLQSAIARISNYNATLKNYCITLTSAICGFAITLKNPIVILLALLPITILAILDAQYLRTERQFRTLYEHARLEEWGTIPSFDMNVSKMPRSSFWGAFFSWSVCSFYLPLLIGIVAVMLIVWKYYV